MKIEILNEKELKLVTGGKTTAFDCFVTGIKQGAVRGPKGIKIGVSNIYYGIKTKIEMENANKTDEIVGLICDSYSWMPSYAVAKGSGQIVGGTAVTAGVVAATCTAAYGAYKLGKYAYNKLKK